MADDYIAGWDSRFHHDFWRPYTAIREAAEDGHADTAPESAWEPSVPTPPVQDYPSTHSALGDAAAEVLASVFRDATEFSFTSPSAVSANGKRSFNGPRGVVTGKPRTPTFRWRQRADVRGSPHRGGAATSMGRTPGARERDGKEDRDHQLRLLRGRVSVCGAGARIEGPGT